MMTVTPRMTTDQPLICLSHSLFTLQVARGQWLLGTYEALEL
jgi:hypothetical protein